MMECVIKSPTVEKRILRSSGYNNKLVVLKDNFLFDFQALEVLPEI